MKRLLSVSLLAVLNVYAVSVYAQENDIQIPLTGDEPSNISGDSYGMDGDATVTGEVENESYAEGESSALRNFNMNYFGILYGTSLGEPSSFQPTPDGVADRDRPVIVKNFMNLGYNFSDTISMTGTAYWIWQPVQKQQMQLQDPFVRLAHNSIFSTDRANLYGDIRVHFPVTIPSRENDMQFGVQSVQVLTYAVGTSRLTVGTYSSVRVNSFGSDGFGNDMELYLAPNMNYQVSPTVALTLLYEMQTSHFYGEKPFRFVNDGMDIEPGVSWDITPNIMVNPYLHFPVGGKMGMRSTSFGMMFNWALI